MADRHAERTDKEVRYTMLEMLRERVADPTKIWRPTGETTEIERVAGNLLADAGLIVTNGEITLAGMDYYRRETKRFKWLRENWFPVFVAVVTAGATLTAAIITVFFGDRPC